MVEQRNLSITILETSDLHGHIFPISYGTNEYDPSGLAKIATYIKQTQETEKNIILIDNGDSIQGTPLTYHYVRQMHHLPNPMIQTFNELKYDAAIIGNHEFNYGLPILHKGIQEAQFPFLSANILHMETKGPYFGPPYHLKTLDNGFKVAILGLTTHYIPNWEKPEHIKDLVFENSIESATKWISYIKEKEAPDLFIVSYHGGFERDLKTGQPTEALTGENQAYQLCKEVGGFDLLLTGHQHRLLSEEINGITIIQPGCNGQFLGRVDLHYTYTSADGWKCMSKNPSLISLESIDVDKQILHMNKPYEEGTQNWLDQSIGQIHGDMLIQDPFEARTKEHPFIEFINRVQMETADVDISNTALFHNQALGLSANVTMREIVSNYIYPNTLTVIELSGQDIKDALEKTATYFMINEQGQIDVNPQFVEPKPQHYHYDMYEGIFYTIDVSKPIGKRVVDLMKDGEPLHMDGSYHVVMNNYRATGGGNYHMFKGKKVIREIQLDMTEILAHYFSKHKIIKAGVNHNWKVMKS